MLRVIKNKTKGRIDMKKRVVTALIIILVLMFSVQIRSYASGGTIDSVITQMGEANKLDNSDKSMQCKK